MVLEKLWVYRRWPAVATLPIGQVHQLVVTGTNAHPLHIHIQPFQITAFSSGATNLDNGYFAVGDWHDTLLTASAGGGTTVTVRMQTDTFTGKAVVHCHILEHEDEGMMAWFSITGIENTTYAAATTLEPTCYRGSYTCTASAGTTCSANVCTCPNGTPTTASGSGGTLCESNGNVDCSACSTGYTISAAAGAGAQTCSANVCTCPNGTPTTASGSGGTLCESNGNVDCSACSTGYTISAAAGAGAQTCS
eukprot:COSAG01_NODE_4743_length_4771_cov_36.935360_1_plen_249_part_10